MMNKMPDRVFDVGIAEQHAVTFSAGLAASGHIPFCNVYSTFLQRAYDQIIHDVALQKLQVVFFLDRAGLVGEDGATHHGAFDLAYLRCIPNMTVAAPMNEEELRDMMYTAQLEGTGPIAIRYPRGRGVIPKWKTPFKRMEIGKGERTRDGKDLALVTIGHVGNSAKAACEVLEKEGISVAHYNLRFLKPIDNDLLHEIFKRFSRIITVEDGTIIGGLGSALLEFMSDQGYNAKIKRLGIPDHFIEQGTIAELHRECGYDVDGIVSAVRAFIS
jgi:1-deoxy-D-xylulose-5-phosphate synthase